MWYNITINKEGGDNCYLLTDYALTPFETEINNAKSLLLKATNKLDESLNNIQNNNIDKAIANIIDYEVCCEKIINHARLLPNYSGTNCDKIIEENIVNESNITIDFIENNWLYMKIPFLLPKKEKGSASYIRATVQTAFKNYLRTNTINKIKKESIIIFQHIYDKNTPTTSFRDHDNIEINVVVDSIALYVLTDDSPLLLKHYYTTNMGDSSYTNIFVIPIDDFNYWLNSYEKNCLLGNTNISK